MACLGEAGRASQGSARRGPAWSGRHGRAALGRALCGQVWQGMARLARCVWVRQRMLRHGLVRQGMAWKTVGN
jgi:hypothetical protein